MGAEIDSLADAVNFGVAPALVVYVTLLSASRVGWIFALLYASASCCGWPASTRCSTTTEPAYTREYFAGMPAPAGPSA